MGATPKLLRFIAAIACVAVLAPDGPSHLAAAQDVTKKLDRVLKVRSEKTRGGSRSSLTPEVPRLGRPSTNSFAALAGR